MNAPTEAVSHNTVIALDATNFATAARAAA